MSVQNWVKTENSNKNLLIIFSGHVHTKDGKELRIQENLFQNRIEFTQAVVKNTSADVLWIKDPKNEFFLNGIAGIGDSVEEVAEFIKTFAVKYEKVITIGNCSASFPATLYGSLLNIHAVISYLPLINLSILTPKQFRFVKDLYDNNREVYEKYKDLKPFLNNTTRYYCQPPRLNDELHTDEHYQEIKHLPNVYKIEAQAIPYLIEIGKFEALLENLFKSEFT